MPLTTAAFNSNTTQGSLARAVRPVPIRIITVAKGNSRGAELMASASCASETLRCNHSLNNLDPLP